VSLVAPLDAKLLRDLWRIRTQAIAVALVIGCGVAVMVMSFGAMRSLSETREAYYERYYFANVFAQARRVPLHIAAKIAALPGVASVEPRIVSYVSLFIPDLARPAIGQLISLPDGRPPRNNAILLRTGRLPARDSDEVVVSENLANAHGYGPGDRLAANINGRRRELSIVGVALSPEFIYVLGPGQLIPDNKSFGVLWLDRQTLEAAYDLEGAFNQISVSLMRNASEPEVIARMDRLLEPYGGTGAFGREDQLSHAFVEQELDQLRVAAAVMPPIFLAVAAFLIHMIMTRLTELEREQIGLLKAFGYSDAAVGWHYAKFAFAVAALGSLLGVGAGVWLGFRMTELYGNYYHFPFLYFRTDPAILVSSVAVSFLAPLIGTWQAVKKAVRLPPAVAMAPAPPTVYRQTIIERLHLDRAISEPTHMIVRHLERWPLRSAMTALGIALAGALLIGTLFTFDSIDEIIDNAYFRTNRQDATIDFLEPRDARAAFDIARWPGVRRVEPVRAVPARLVSGHLSQRVGISGVTPGATLKQFIAADGKPFAVPPAGLVLSDKLARLLAVTPGDRLRVEILEGRRRRVDVVVASVVGEHIGLSAYMDKRSLDALSGGGDVITGVQVLLDPQREQAFFAAAQEAPSTGTIMLRTTAIQSFQEVLAQNLVIVISLYAAFCGVIAFGVIYNAARIALSERGRELASLRVLGFSKAEAAYILTGELAILVLLALPVAAVLGYGLAALMSVALETELFRIPLVVERSTYGFMATIVLASAAISLLAVARRVARLDLVSVLKARE
jgi:putative ABC transport system permease protein